MRKSLVLLLVGWLVLSACSGGGGNSSPRIINPSFETLGANPDGFQPYGWVRQGVNDWDLSTYGVKRLSGGGFMPTDGQYFLEFPSSDKGAVIFPGSYPSLSAYQDDVDLSNISSFIFDYEVSNVLILAGGGVGGYDGAANVSIYFQPNSGGLGTVTLWTKDYGPGAGAEQVLDNSVVVQDGLDLGRLTIQVTTSESRDGSLVSASKLTFRIDYLEFL